MFHRSITNSSFARMAPITAGYRFGFNTKNCWIDKKRGEKENVLEVARGEEHQLITRNSADYKVQISPFFFFFDF